MIPRLIWSRNFYHDDYFASARQYINFGPYTICLPAHENPLTLILVFENNVQVGKFFPLASLLLGEKSWTVAIS
ncbi:MAG: hypothetical protein IPL20_14390 [Saprospiraceae bacterium]|nr:hypothetical protein [Saprospiraceae bacterium]